MRRRLLLIFAALACWTSYTYGQITAPFTETFSSGLPSGWSNTTVPTSTSTNAFWKFSGNMGYDASAAGSSTNNFAWADGSSPAQPRVELTTDSIDVSGLTTPELSFLFYSYNLTYASSGYNTLFVDFYDGTTWHDSIWGYSGSSATSTFQNAYVDLSTYTISGKVLVRFVVDQTTASTAFYNDIALDDVAVKNAPACPRIFNFASTGTTTSRVDLSWTNTTATSYGIIYGSTGFDPRTAGTTVTKTASPDSVTGLMPATLYDFYIYGICGTTGIGDTTGPISAQTQCAGTLTAYTINQNAAASASNFTSFTAMAAFMSSCGITANTTVTVTSGSGPYNEQVLLTSIPGAGPNARLTITASAGDTLEYASSTSGQRATLTLDGADYVTIDGLSVKAGYDGATYGYGVQLINGADNNILRNMTIDVYQGSTSSFFSGLVMNGSFTSPTSGSTANNNNLVENNTIYGGYYGITSSASSSNRAVGNVIEGNTVEDFYIYGIYNLGQDSTFIRDNDINRANRSTVSTGYGVFTSSSGRVSEISGNWIHDMFGQASGTTSSFYAIYQSSSDNAAGDEANVFNNVVSNNYNDGLHYLIYNFSSDGWNYYHNTLVEDDPTAGGTTRMFYQTSTADRITLANNLFYMDRGGSNDKHLIYLNSSTSTVTLNNNAYYAGNLSDPAVDFGYLSGDIASLAAWQTATSQDANSVFGDPIFDPNTTYVPTAAYFNNIGQNLNAIVAVDFSGASRSATPDPGAFEFTPPPGPDMAIDDVFGLGGASCGTSTDVGVVVSNLGTDTVLTFTLNYSINGTAQTAIVNTDTFFTGKVDTIVLSAVPLSATSVTNVTASISAVGPGTDVDAGNNNGSIAVRPGYSGNLYVNQLATPNDSTFTSFTNLANALMSSGICGPVVVEVLPNQFNFIEQFKLGEIPGASMVNTVTINGNGNTIEYTSTMSSERGVIMLNGTDYLTIDSLNINAAPTSSTSSEYGFALSLYNGADHNTYRKGTINVTTASTSSNYVGISISGSPSSSTSQGLSGSHNTIENNTIIGGYYGITAVSSTSDKSAGNSIIGNVIQDPYAYPIYTVNQDSIRINNNDGSRPTRTSFTTFYGIYASGASSNSEIIGNRLHNNADGNTSSTSTAYPIFLSGWDGDAANPNVVANNMIYDINSGGTVYGIYCSSVDNVLIYHNTIALINASAPASSFASTRGVYFTGSGSGNEFKNNILYTDRNSTSTSYVIYVVSSSTGYTFDNNVYYQGPNTADFGYYGSSTSNINGWKNLTGMDAAAVDNDPFFVDTAANNFTPQSLALDGLGANLTAVVATDIDGVTRASTPDPGALEFTGAPCTGLAGLGLTNTTANSASFGWTSVSHGVTAEWGPTGFKQASIVGTIVSISSPASALNLTGLSPNTCYDVYFTLNCSSSIPGAPPVIGPITFCTPCLSQLSGSYTIGGAAGPTNFATLDSAISTLNGCGISGPVIFNLAGGASYGAALIEDIQGSSATNTITFNGNTTTPDTIAGVELNGTQHISFNDLVIAKTSGFTVRMYNQAEFVSFDNCVLINDVSSTTSANANFVASGSATSATSSGNNVNHVSLTNSTVIGGYYGVSIYGPGSTSHNVDVNISNNSFRDQYYYGVRVYYMDSTRVVGNDMSDGFRNTFSYGNYLYYGDYLTFEQNAVYGATYGIYTYGQGLIDTNGTATVINNMLSGSTYGFYSSTMRNMDVFNNSFAGGTRAAYMLGNNTNLDIRNNIFASSGTALYVSTIPTNATVDYNLYDTLSGGSVAYWGSAYAGLPAFAAVIGNQNSLTGTAGFTAVDDFHIVGTSPNDVGDNSTGVLVDIDGDVRPAVGSTTIDIGADEFTPLNFDVELSGLIVEQGCGDSTTEVSVIMQNFGLNAATGFSVGANVSGSVTATLSAAYTGSIPSLGFDTLLLGSYNTYAGAANVDITAILAYTADQDPSNDTTSISGLSYLPYEPVGFDTTVCISDDSAFVRAQVIPGIAYNWFASNAATDTIPVTTGDTAAFALPLSQSTYYLAYRSSIDSLATPFNGNNRQAGNAFDVLPTSTVEVNGFGINIAGTGPQQMRVYYRSGSYVGFNTSDAGWTLHDTLTVTPLGVGSITQVPLSSPILLSAGNVTSFMILTTSGGTMEYTNGTSVGTLLSQNNDLTVYEGAGISWPLGSNFNPRNWNGVIYYAAAACSEIRTPININVTSDTATAAFSVSGTQPSFNFDASASTNATGYAWDFGDGNNGTGVTTSHTYASNGTYTVTLTVTDTVGCISTAIADTTLTLNVGLEENALSQSLVVYPNPASDRIKIAFDAVGSKSAVIRILDVSGKEVARYDVNNINNGHDAWYDLNRLARGMYTLQIKSGELTTNRKLIVQ